MTLPEAGGQVHDLPHIVGMVKAVKPGPGNLYDAGHAG